MTTLIPVNKINHVGRFLRKIIALFFLNSFLRFFQKVYTLVCINIHLLVKILQEIFISLLVFFIHSLIKFNLFFASLLAFIQILIKDFLISHNFFFLEHFFFLLFGQIIKIIGLQLSFSNLVIDICSWPQLHEMGHSCHRAFFNCAFILLLLDLLLNLPCFESLPCFLNKALLSLPLARLPLVLSDNHF